MSRTDTAAEAQSSQRLKESLYDHDAEGEKKIAVAQGLICVFVLALHCLTQLRGGVDAVSPWAAGTLMALIASSALRLRLAQANVLPNRAVDVLNVLDISIFLLFIWSCQAYGQPAGGALKAPSFAFLFALVALRALRFDPRQIIITGLAAIGGWALMVGLAIETDGAGALTYDYGEYLTSYRVLIGAEAEKLFALAALVIFLASAMHKAREILSKVAHASDYAEALGSVERHLSAARAAKEKAERALAELDRRDEELTEQNRRFNAALANMSQGLCMFGRDQRLLVCNDRYIEMYRLPAVLARPGTPFRRIVEYRAANGAYSGNSPESYLDERLSSVTASEPSTKIQQLNDGRVIEIRHQPLADGGWVATHEDVTMMHRTQAHMSHMARHDALTNLPNRVQLRERMDEALYGAGEDAQPLVLLVLNIDRFKEINDTLGHTVGDTLLQFIAQRLSEEAHDCDMVARIGGDEFAIIKMTEKPIPAAAALAENIQDVLSLPFDIDGHQLVIGASVGIAIAPRDGNESDLLLKNADLALDRAKSEGRGKHCFYEQEMDERLQARRCLEQDLRLAIANGEFEVCYQPQLNLERNEISGCEALVRWRHPLRGTIPPGAFIPIAEETGLIVQIGEWVLRKACADASAWPRDIRVAVNLSAIQLKRSDVLKIVTEALGASGLAAKRLELEVTESVLLDEHRDVLNTLEKLHDLGVRISLDDFGTGYSSLGYLKRFPFDKIKLDRSFVSELADGNPNSGAIVRTVAALGQNLGIATTAEGVETQEQLELVRKEGYTEIQGYYLSPPVPVGDLAPLFSLSFHPTGRAPAPKRRRRTARGRA